MDREQVTRAKMWDYRRAGYRKLALRLGDPGRAAYDEVFAAAPQA